MPLLVSPSTHKASQVRCIRAQATHYKGRGSSTELNRYKAGQQVTLPRLPQARSQRSGSDHSELSVEKTEKTKAGLSLVRLSASPSVRAGRPVSTDLNPYAAALARFYAASGHDPRRRQALKSSRSFGGQCGNLAAVRRAAREAGWTLADQLAELEQQTNQHLQTLAEGTGRRGTLKTQLDDLESTLEQQLDLRSFMRGRP